MTARAAEQAGRGGEGGRGGSGTGERRAPAVATPWGGATLVAQAAVPQRAGERRFSSMVQLLADERGEPLVRFAYSTGGVARRGPVTLRVRDLEKLRAAVAAQPALLG